MNTEPEAPVGNPKIHRLEPAMPTWFFERPDGTVFGCHNNEAWQNLQRSNAHTKLLKLLGMSDGRLFQDAIRRSHEHFRATNDIEGAKQIIREGERAEIEAARGNMKLPIDPTHVNL